MQDHEIRIKGANGLNSLQDIMQSHSTDPLTVCVTGAAGQIAYSFLPLLLTGQVFGSRKINLRLLDIPQCEQALKGVIMEVKDAVFPNLQSVISGSNPNEIFKDAQVIVFLGGSPRKPGMERKDLLELNKKIFVEQGQALSVASKEVRCVIIANPANTNATILSHFSKDYVKPENITCLSRLDHNRAISQIAEVTGAKYEDIHDVVIFGNHSLTQYPSIETPTVNGKPLKESVDKEWLEKTFIETVQKRGGEVLKARSNSSVFSAACAVKDHLRDWYQGTNGKVVSMGIVSQGHYNIPKGLWTSLPVKCDNFSYSIVTDVKISQFCEEKIKVTVQELQDELKEADIAL